MCALSPLLGGGVPFCSVLDPDPMGMSRAPDAVGVGGGGFQKAF